MGVCPPHISGEDISNKNLQGSVQYTQRPQVLAIKMFFKTLKYSKAIRVVVPIPLKVYLLV